MMTITRKRGDNYPIKATIKVNGEAIDLTGSIVTFSFKLLEDSTDIPTSIVGDMDLDNIGVITFSPTVEQMDTVGAYKFDIQRVSNSIVATHLSGILLLDDDVSA